VPPTPSNRFAADGTNAGNFDRGDWGLLLTTAMIWGSSFLWIAISLDSFHPGAIACGRMILGAAVLWTVPAARTAIPRTAWPAMAVVAIAGNAAPAVFFPLAQERVESSVAGMLNSVSPMIVLVISVIMVRSFPQRRQIIGLLIGLIGAVLIAIPNLAGSDAQPLGVAFVLAAVSGYALSNNFLPRLVQDYNATAVIARAMLAAALLLLPYGIFGATQSSFSWGSAAALTILGVVGTGFARSIFAALTGRVGAPRSGLVGYLVPVVAVILGVVVRNEAVGALELAGTGLILVGAAFISRGRK